MTQPNTEFLSEKHYHSLQNAFATIKGFMDILEVSEDQKEITQTVSEVCKNQLDFLASYSKSDPTNKKH